MSAQRKWEKEPYEKRADVFLRAAKLMQDEYRMDLMATTMLGQVSYTYYLHITSHVLIHVYTLFNLCNCTMHYLYL